MKDYTTREVLEQYTRDSYRPMAMPLATYLLDCCKTKTIPSELREFMELHNSTKFADVPGYGVCVWSNEPFNNMFFDSKNGNVLTEINWDEIFWDILFIIRQCSDDGYYRLRPYQNKLILETECSDNNLAQNNTIGYICHFLKIPFTVEIHKFSQSYKLIGKTIAASLYDAFQQLNNIDFSEERMDLAYTKEFRYTIECLPIITE